MKNKYSVTVSWLTTKELEIEADSPEQARELANQWGDNQSNVPDGGNYIDCSFDVDSVIDMKKLLEV